MRPNRKEWESRVARQARPLRVYELENEIGARNFSSEKAKNIFLYR